MERIILAAILVAAVTAAGFMLRRSFRRAAAGKSPCVGCPMSGTCDGAGAAEHHEGDPR
jgi:hypothetical protein